MADVLKLYPNVCPTSPSYDLAESCVWFAMCAHDMDARAAATTWATLRDRILRLKRRGSTSDWLKFVNAFEKLSQQE